MSQRPSFMLVAALGLITAQACSGGGLFSDQDPNSSGSGGNTSTAQSSSVNNSSSGSGATGGMVTSSGSGGAGGDGVTVSSSSSSAEASSSSSGGGGAPPCAHDPCEMGGALNAECDPCVGQICAADPFCCNNNWDELCQGAVYNLCGVDCNPGQVLCDAQYNTAPGYYLCVQATNECAFGINTTTPAGSCEQFCANQGGECVTVFNDQQQNQCGYAQEVPCTTNTFMTAICICSRGCGNGPPCMAGQTCVMGACQ